MIATDRAHHGCDCLRIRNAGQCRVSSGESAPTSHPLDSARLTLLQWHTPVQPPGLRAVLTCAALELQLARVLHRDDWVTRPPRKSFGWPAKRGIPPAGPSSHRFRCCRRGDSATLVRSLTDARLVDRFHLLCSRYCWEPANAISATRTRPAKEEFGEIALLVAQHHERWDGAGYRRAIAGKNIHRLARLLSIADVFDALATARSYRKPWPAERIRSISSETERASSTRPGRIVCGFVRCVC